MFCNIHSCADSIKPEKAGILWIIISIFAALLMILSSYLIRDTQFSENSQMVTYIIMAVWWLPFYVLTKRSWSAVIANNKKK
jgi:hypothetical protein